MKINKLLIALSVIVLILIAGCDVKNGITSTILELPTGSTLDLYSADEGIHPNKDILDNPANPFADASLNMENVWDFSDESPSAISRFYLWGTILAKIPIGEYQYFTAKALHEIYTESGSMNAREHAKKAYRAVLDHFYDSVTWWSAWWVDEDTYYAVILRDMVGEAMYDPSEMNLLPLYSDPALALADLSEWGYVYDFEAKKITKRN
ncbi:MAG: hypothetical protein JXR56_07770 [Candidatus Cloacimonetes bacterium]|nr:hypothetical protein [Candidatus Cloacimonadota bacterium]